MRPFVVKPLLGLEGEISLLGDKSIAHRALILGAVSCGKTIIKNFPANDDCLATLKILQELGVPITKNIQSPKKLSLTVNIEGRGLYGLRKPRKPLFCSESGTTLRLLLGLLAGQNFSAYLKAAPSLSSRPMLRVTAPLRLMGAAISARRKTQGAKREEYPPVRISGGGLKSIIYKMPVASAQVKSALLLAGLYADGKTIIIEPVRTRDHTERMLRLFKAGVKVIGNKIVIKRRVKLSSPGEIFLPGDISSAAFFMVLASLIPGARITIKKVSLNPLRTGVIRVLKRMGAHIKVTKSQSHKVTSAEPIGDLLVKSSSLRGTVVRKKEIPSLIDELPVLMVAASFAKGKTVFEGAEELRVKETDRIRSMSLNLRKMGARISLVKRGNAEKVVITGTKPLKAVGVSSFGDHRTAMSMIVAGLAAHGSTKIDDISCINKSFPDFIAKLNSLKH
ncbi:MAG: 3-phosphoshikimate 1-carboxyvinyltransferase [Candidatus Omnitrophota bacterium]